MSAKLSSVEQRAPRVFGREAITLGIGPYTSLVYFLSIKLQTYKVCESEIAINHLKSKTVLIQLDRRRFVLVHLLSTLALSQNVEVKNVGKFGIFGPKGRHNKPIRMQFGTYVYAKFGSDC